MQDKFPVMGIETDKDSVIYRMKNSTGAYDEVSISDHHYLMHELKEYVEEIKVQNGLSLFIIDIPAETAMEVEYSASDCPLGFGITLECDHECAYHRDGQILSEDKSENNCLIIGKSNNTNGKFIKKAGTPLKVVSVVFDRNLINILFRNQISLIRPEYEDYFGDNDTFYQETHIATPALLAAARAIHSCPYQSPKRELCLNSKAYELLNYVFSDFFIEDSAPLKKSVLQPGEVEKIQAVKGYILEHMETPPSLTELSRISGINDFKLKAGFKEVYGTTVYGFIHSEKMAKAKAMLETGRHSVSEVAWDVGYTNVSHFIKAFKKRYRITPGQMLFSIKSELLRHSIKYSVQG